MWKVDGSRRMYRVGYKLLRPIVRQPNFSLVDMEMFMQTRDETPEDTPHIVRGLE
jgi:hypothetical protein